MKWLVEFDFSIIIIIILDANECNGENGGNHCSSNAICTNIYPSFSCACKIGYSGDGVNCQGFLISFLFFLKLSIFLTSIN